MFFYFFIYWFYFLSWKLFVSFDHLIIRSLIFSYSFHCLYVLQKLNPMSIAFGENISLYVFLFILIIMFIIHNSALNFSRIYIYYSLPCDTFSHSKNWNTIIPTMLRTDH